MDDTTCNDSNCYFNCDGFSKTNGIKIFEGKLDFNNFKVLATPKVIESLWLSFLYSLVATICCIIIAYPIAYIIARAHFHNRFLVLSFWFFLCGRILYLEQKQLLVYLWKGILFHLCLQNWVNFAYFRFVWQTAWSDNWNGFHVFTLMILPIYTVLEKLIILYMMQVMILELIHFKLFGK